MPFFILERHYDGEKPMKLFLSFIIAYLIFGIHRVIEDLSAHFLNKPGWALQPTIGKIVFIALVWPFISFVRGPNGRSVGIVRKIVFWLPGFIIPMCFMASYIWGCISITDLFIQNLLLEIIACSILFLLGGVFIFPLMNLLMLPATAIVAGFLSLLFPLRKEK